jgi:hypothetical protein
MQVCVLHRAVQPLTLALIPSAPAALHALLRDARRADAAVASALPILQLLFCWNQLTSSAGAAVVLGH